MPLENGSGHLHSVRAPFTRFRRPLTVGALVPPVTLPLSVKDAVAVDLEQTYTRAAAAAYLS